MYNVIPFDPQARAISNLPTLAFAQNQASVSLAASDFAEIPGVNEAYAAKRVSIMRGQQPVYTCSIYLGPEDETITVIERTIGESYLAEVYIEDEAQYVTIQPVLLQRRLREMGVMTCE